MTDAWAAWAASHALELFIVLPLLAGGVAFWGMRAYKLLIVISKP